MNNFEKSNRIDELEKKLYSPNQNIILKNRRKLNPESYDVAQDWEHEPTPPDEIPEEISDTEKSPNWFFRFFILALIFFLGAASYVGIKLYLNWGVQAPHTEILINAPLSVGAGEAFSFETIIQNQNQIPLKFVTLEVQFPDGTRVLEDIARPYPSASETIELIDVGQIVKKNYNALLFGEEGEKKEISIFVTYQVDGSTTLFKKEKKFDVVLSSTPVRLTVTHVKEITSGQDIIFTVELVSNSTQTLKNVMVQANYPFGFAYKTSSRSPQEDKRTWIIDTLKPKETITFTIQGTMSGQNKDDKFFSFIVGLQNLDNTQTPQVVFTKKDALIAIARPFLEANIQIGEKKEDIAVLTHDSNSIATINFTNNTGTPLRNAIITLLIKGNAIPEESIYVSGGFFQSLNDTITWDNSTSEKLSFIPAGSSNSVSFNFTPSVYLNEQIIVNPEATMTLNIKANRNPDDKVSDVIENSITQKIKVNSEIEIQTWSEFVSTFFQNSGMVPPKVEQKTTYTAVIDLKNTSNQLTGGVVKLKVPNYVQYEGIYKPSTENVSYDSVTREITWRVGEIAPKTGYIGSPKKQLALQVSIIPSVSQINTTPALLSDIVFTVTDSYTQSELSKDGNPISTQIKDTTDYYQGSVSR